MSEECNVSFLHFQIAVLIVEFPRKDLLRGKIDDQLRREGRWRSFLTLCNHIKVKNEPIGSSRAGDA